MKHALLALFFATPAAADCVTAADLATGITFSREDGRHGLAKSDGKNVRINYSTNPDDWTDTRLSRLGIYDLWANIHFDTLPTVGGGYPHYDWTYAGRPPEPMQGRGFTSKVNQKRSEDIGTEVEPPAEMTTFTVTYAFQDAIVAELSGCPYTIIPVEAAYSTGQTQRWLYFPDLGFGLETRTRGMDGQPPVRRGLTALKPAS